MQDLSVVLHSKQPAFRESISLSYVGLFSVFCFSLALQMTSCGSGEKGPFLACYLLDRNNYCPVAPEQSYTFERLLDDWKLSESSALVSYCYEVLHSAFLNQLAQQSVLTTVYCNERCKLKGHFCHRYLAKNLIWTFRYADNECA
jgi:hypothetical protein